MQERKIGFEIRSVSNLIRRDIEKSPLKRDIDALTGIHGWAIGYFYENSDHDIFQRDFEEKFSIRRSTATNILKLMEKNGFITRERVSYDARLKKIILTDRALELYRRIEAEINERESRMVRGISSAELETFFAVTEKLKHNLEDED